MGKSIIVLLSTGVVLTSPMGGVALARILLKELEKKSREGNHPGYKNEEGRVRASLYRLKRRGFIEEKVAQDGSVAISLSERGRMAFPLGIRTDLTSFRVSRGEKWDGVWRFVMFDVPEENRFARNVLRDKIKRAGFFQIQQSIWVYPYACTKEIEDLADFLGIPQCVLVFEGKVSREERLKEFFLKKGYRLD